MLSETGTKAYYIIEVIRENSYFLWKQTKSRILEVNDTWFRDHQLAYVQNDKGRTILVDLKKMTCTYIDHYDETYVEFTLPVDVNQILAHDLRFRRLGNMFTGQVKEVQKTKIIHDVTCQEYKVTAWALMDGVKTRKSTYRVWATQKVPFNLEPFHMLLDILRNFYGRDEAFRSELKKIRGIQLMDRGAVHRFPRKKIYFTEASLWSQKEPPEGIFKVPEGYKRRKRIREDDIR